MTYRAPVSDIAFALKHAAGLKAALAEGLYGDLDEETVDSVLAEAGRFASDVIAPLNAVGDKFGTPFKDGAVTTPPGWKEAYTSWAAAGWNGLAGPADFGGQDLPHAVNAACIEMWNSASMAFGIGPVLTMAAVDALHAYGSDELKAALSRKAHHRRMDGHHAAHRAAGGLRRRRAAHQGRARGRRQLPHHRLQDLHHLWRARPHRQHHPLRARPPARRAARHQGHFAVPDPQVPAGRHAQRRARAFGRAQARHPCLAHLHHGLWRSRRRDRLPHRRGTQGHGLHVHHDEPGTAGGRPAGRGDRRARAAAGAWLMRASASRAPPAPSSITPTSSACC